MHDKSPADVSAVVCTRNSIASIEQCLVSLKSAGVGEIIVVDAKSTDGTQDVVARLADRVLHDDGIGLGKARNLGIAVTSLPLVLNMGSDNVLPKGQLDLMIQDLQYLQVEGVGARTLLVEQSYVARGLNAWRQGRFVPGPVVVIGTPTLFNGEMLRSSPYDPTRRFSDDSELCERWSRQFDARFAISHAYVQEIGKSTWAEVWVRCKMYGVSDSEIYREGSLSGWSTERRAKSLAHPLKSDFLTCMSKLDMRDRISYGPFLAGFALGRYVGWMQEELRTRRSEGK